jgi:hypothetical protein
MKGVLQPDHIPLNKYELRVRDLPPITFITISGWEEELEDVDLPDRTAASGGNTKPIEFTATIPLHHVIEVQAMEAWFQMSQDPVSPNYKKTGTLVLSSISGLVRKTILLIGMFPCKRKTGDLEMANEGELHVVEWTFRGDDVIAI